MVHTLRFQIDVTRYFLFRQQEWCFEAVLGGVEGETVHLDLQIPHAEEPMLATFERCSFSADDPLCLTTQGASGREDEVIVSIETVEMPYVTLRFDLPDGVKLEPMAYALPVRSTAGLSFRPPSLRVAPHSGIRDVGLGFDSDNRRVPRGHHGFSFI